MTTADFHPSQGAPTSAVAIPAAALQTRVALTCRSAANGRRAIRAIATWVAGFELSEPEFQVLWCLHSQAGGGLDQTTLARQLAFSPAQVSTTVERMRAKAWIVPARETHDRRRHLWQLSAGGQRLVDQMLKAADVLHFVAQAATEESAAARRPPEAAA